MSFSKEHQDYHLTPRGWEEGSFQGDALGGSNNIPTPSDRVMTITCIDEMSSPYSKTIYSDRISWKSDDKNAIKNLQNKFGDKPDWFGYKKM